MNRIQEMRAQREARGNVDIFGHVDDGACEEAERDLTEALDGWEQAEAELTRLREWEGEYLAAVQLASECFADLDAAGVSFSSIAWQMCLALTQENNEKEERDE